MFDMEGRESPCSKDGLGERAVAAEFWLWNLDLAKYPLTDVPMSDEVRSAWRVAAESLFLLLFRRQKKTKPQRSDSTTIPDITPAMTGPPGGFEAWFSSCAVSNPVPELATFVWPFLTLPLGPFPLLAMIDPLEGTITMDV
jgi:hypothetical protein